MKRTTIAGLLLALTACHFGVSYTHVGWGYWGYSGYGHGTGAFSTSYGETGIVWNAPGGAGAPPPVLQNDTPVEGSDGTFGWKRAAANADFEIHRITEALARAQCNVVSHEYDETRAVCGDVPMLVRRDSSRVYLLCGAGAQRGACQQAWVRVLGAAP
jgi:hypothetical protein